ncbi:MAG: oligosaccharide flippase family protein [Bacteroidales bacterium]|nr:oligosaccharide flippase family protein [Bacteroidales bacterium]
MKRKFVTNLALLLFLNLLIKPVYAFGIDVSVQNAVGSLQYGNFFILLNFSLIFSIILDLGIENFNRREIARHQHILDRYFSSLFPLKLILGAIYFVICTLIGYLLGWSVHEFTLLWVLLFNQFLASFILYLRSNLGGLHMFKIDSFLSVLDRFVVIVICGFLLLEPLTRKAFRIEWFVYAQTAAYLISAAIAFSVVFSKATSFKFQLNFKTNISFLRKSYPFALLTLFMAAYLRIDSVLLGKLLDDGKLQAGIYAQSFRIVEILSNYGYLFTIILLPIFSRMIKRKVSVEQLSKLSFLLLFVPAIVITMGCMFFSSEIVDILYNAHIPDSSRVFKILIFSFLGMCTTYIFGTLLTANGSLKELNIMALSAVILNLSLNLILIPRMGVYGAAITNVSTQVFTSLIQILLVVKLFKFQSNYSLIVRLLLFTGVLIFTGFLIRKSQWNWYYLFGLFLIIGGLLSFILRLFSFRSLFDILFSAETE